MDIAGAEAQTPRVPIFVKWFTGCGTMEKGKWHGRSAAVSSFLISGINCEFIDPILLAFFAINAYRGSAGEAVKPIYLFAYVHPTTVSSLSDLYCSLSHSWPICLLSIGVSLSLLHVLTNAHGFPQDLPVHSEYGAKCQYSCQDILTQEQQCRARAPHMQ